MLSGIALQTADLKWFVPMVVGAIALIGCIVAFLVRPNQGWNLSVVAALAVALIGASVFTKVSVTTEGVTIETAQLSAQVLSDLETASKANTNAITELSVRVDQLAAVTKQVSAAQPATSSHADELGQISQDAQKIQESLKANNAILQQVGRNNALIQKSLGIVK
jgi:hypothetical protein